MFINICDLVDKPVTRTKVKLFVSEKRLSNYSKRQKKIFPLSVNGEVKSGLVDPLLRRIEEPEDEDLSLADHPDELECHPQEHVSPQDSQANVCQISPDIPTHADHLSILLYETMIYGDTLII
jgi:hypothetical protein